MFVEQFYVEALGHYSYLIGSTDAKVGFVVDPKLDVDDYVNTARQMGMRISHILGTHLHNGELEVRVLETPGPTPEHLSYVVYDTARSREMSVLILSGADLLVGSVGRPDLLGPELGAKLAPQLYDSLHEKILPVGDSVM